MIRFVALAALLSASWACDDGDADPGFDATPPDAAADAQLTDAARPDAEVPDAALDVGLTADAGAPDAVVADAAIADAAPPACTPEDPDACRYTPVVRDALGERRVVELEYMTIAGSPRSVFIEVRAPANPTPDTPIVVWSHGGSGGRVDPTTVASAWSQTFVRAGYMVVVIAHPGHDQASYTALCEAMGLSSCAPRACMGNADCSVMVDGAPVAGSCTAGMCRFFKPGNWDRPNDVRAVLDWIEAEADDGLLAGRADPTRIVYAGHSAGAGSTNMVAGATRQYEPGDADRLLIDPRPIGFISCSPQGPGDDGFTVESFDRSTCAGIADAADRPACLSRPHLTLTGVDDGGVGPSRRQSFDLAPPGNRFMGYIVEPEAQHTTFNLEAESCERVGGTPARCAQYLTWLRSAALSFLDAVLRADSDARTYLTSDAPAVLGGAGWSWETR